MAEKKEYDLIRRFCEGGYKDFKNIPCKYYMSSDRACHLLRQGKSKRFWDQCRLNTLEWIYKAADKYLAVFKKRYPMLHIDEKEDADFACIADRLKKQTIKKDTLISWVGYVNTAVYREIRDFLHKVYKIPKIRRCGNCKYLPLSRPYICSEKGEERKKSDAPCEAYSWEPPPEMMPAPIDDEIIPDFNTPEILLAEKKENLLFRIVEMLMDRIEDENPGSKKRDIYKRQYEVFADVLHELSKIEPDVEENELIRQRSAAIDRAAEKQKVSRKTIMGDIEDIRKFLEKKMSLFFKNGFFYI